MIQPLSHPHHKYHNGPKSWSKSNKKLAQIRFTLAVVTSLQELSKPNPCLWLCLKPAAFVCHSSSSIGTYKNNRLLFEIIGFKLNILTVSIYRALILSPIYIYVILVYFSVLLPVLYVLSTVTGFLVAM